MPLDASSGVIWFNRTLNLIKAHLLGGKHELVTYGPFAYVRHPLYATIMMTVPPLVIVWLADLLFFLPWILIVTAAHCMWFLSRSGVWLRRLARTTSKVSQVRSGTAALQG